MQPEDDKESKVPLSQNSEGSTSPEQPQEIAAEPVDTATQPAGQWVFHADEAVNANGPAAPVAPATVEPVSWTASEYIAHQKSVGWFIGLGFVVAAAAVAIYLLTQELISLIVIIVMGLAFGVFAARQPQVLDYALDENGLKAGTKFYPYGRFKSFSIVHEGAIPSILLMPLQRFMPPLSIYYEPTDEAKVVGVIGNYLPYEELGHDMVDRMMRKIRF